MFLLLRQFFELTIIGDEIEFAHFAPPFGAMVVFAHFAPPFSATVAILTL